MNVEIMETYGDYSAATTGNSPFNSYWILSGSSNLSFGTPAVAPVTDRSMLFNDTSNGFSSNHLRMFAVPVTKVSISAAYNMNDMGDSTGHQIWALLDGSGNIQCYLKQNNLGKIILVGEGGATLATSEGNYVTGTVYCVNIAMEILSASSVVVQCSINGFEDPGLNITADFVDQAVATFAGIKTFAIVGSPAGPGGDWDFRHLMVGTGEAILWPAMELYEGVPGTDIVSDWTPLSGTDNFAMVDEDQPDADTTYNSTETLNALDLFGFADGEVPEEVICIGLVSWAKKEDSATRRFKHALRVSAVDYFGADIFAAVSYGRHLDTWPLNPSTVTAWDPSELAALEAGYQYVGP